MCLGEWSFSEPGFTAIGHPSSLEIARTHGVYVLDDVTATREKYLKGESRVGGGKGEMEEEGGNV